MDSHEDKLAINFRGFSVISCTPVFTPDSKYLLCGSDNGVKVVSVASGECVRELNGHTNQVVSIRICSNNPFQVYTCSLDRTIIKWNYEDGILIKRFHLDFRCTSLYTTTSDDFSLLGLKETNASRYKRELVKFTLPRRHPDDSKIKHTVLMTRCGTQERDVSVGCQSKYVAVINGKSLRVKSLLAKKPMEEKHSLGQKDVSFNCVACHPEEYCVATGCSNGKILLWYNLFAEGHVVKTIKHWHALAVKYLSFTTEGSYLLSGGNECVLVKWQHNSQHRDFLPRLGAPISAITASRDNTLYAVTQDDNSVKIISSTLKVQQVIHGLTKRYMYQRLGCTPVPSGLHVDPKSRALVLNGKPGHLQFYSLDGDKPLFNLDIVGQNFISAENLKHPVPITEVENVAFDPSGHWLATVERRDDHVTTPEIRLKFWAYDKLAQSFILNTNVDLPHQKQVGTLKFRAKLQDDQPPMAVTTSPDKQFKLWALVDDTDIYRTNQCWTCESVGFYRGEEPHCADFSEDGSLLAVAFASVTLWDPDTNALKMVLPQWHGKDETEINKLCFGRNTSSHLLVVSKGSKMAVWNLLTYTILWSSNLCASQIIMDPLSGVMAAFVTSHVKTEQKGQQTTKLSKLMVFKLTSPDPIFKQYLPKSEVIGAVFMPRQKAISLPEAPWLEKSQLVFINKEQKLMTLKLKEEAGKEEKSPVGFTQHLPQTPFSLLMAAQRRKGFQGDALEQHGAVGQPGASNLRQILSIPSHALPPVKSLCLSFMDALVIKNKSHKSSKNSDDESDSEDEDEKMEESDSDSEEDMDMFPGDMSGKQQSQSHSVGTVPDSQTRNTAEVSADSRTSEFDHFSKDMFSWTGDIF